MIYTDEYNSPIGKILLASNRDKLIGLWFDGQKYFAKNLPQSRAKKNLPIFSPINDDKILL